MSNSDNQTAILDAAEALLAHHGASKTGVVDVARALGMSHANVYRYFSNKSALFDAVAERWLERDSAPLFKIARGRTEPSARLKRWLLAIFRNKRRKVIEEPELFAFYKALNAETTQNFVARHTADLAKQLGHILDDGAASGDFILANRDAAIRTILDATASLRHPAIVADPKAIDEKRVVAIADMIVAGLRKGVF